MQIQNKMFIIIYKKIPYNLHLDNNDHQPKYKLIAKFFLNPYHHKGYHAICIYSEKLTNSLQP